MGLGDAAAGAIRPAAAQLRRRAILALIFVIAAVAILVELTVAATIALEPQVGLVAARLVVAGFYVFVLLIAILVFYMMERPAVSRFGPTVQSEPLAQNQGRLALIAEALFLGYALARRARNGMEERDR